MFARLLLFLLLPLAACNASEPDTAAAGKGHELPFRINLPEGFRIAYYATGVKNARAMSLAPDGTLFVGSRSEGKVYALRDADGDQFAESQTLVAQGLEMPTGLVFRNGDLYVSEIERVRVFRNILQNLGGTTPDVAVSGLPDKAHHGWKFIAFGPDGRLYVPVGAPCNICLESDSVFASILSMNPDGSQRRIVAHGVRNSVGFDWHPGTGELWFTDNGRDWLGDDSPPCELNRVQQPGAHYGFPFCHGGSLPDPDFGAQRSCAEFVAPAQRLAAHVAPLGMRFYTGNQFPQEYRNNIFVAEHGSWNRSVPQGYRVMRAVLDAQGHNVERYESFATGWLVGNKKHGRPVDVLPLPDGSLLVSDDYADCIYRISYTP